MAHKPTPAIQRQRTPTGYVRLWDGKDYPVGSVDAACPGLAAYARKHPVLVEEMPNVRWRFAFGFAVITPLVCAGFWGVIFSAVGFSGLPEGGRFRDLATIAAITTLPVASLWTVVNFIMFPWYRPTTFVQDGVISVRTCNRVLKERLAGCSWFIGRTWNMRLARQDTNFLRDPCLVVELGRRPCWDGLAVAVGFTPETRRIWESFLTLAQVPRNSRRDRQCKVDPS